MRVYWNGTIVDESEVCISPWDLGFLRGYGVFDYLAVYGGEPFMLSAHFKRLQISAETIGLSLPLDEDSFSSVIIELLKENALETCYFRTVVTGGISPNGISKKSEPTILVRPEIATPPDTRIYNEGASLITVEYIRDTPLAKTTHYIEAVRKGPLLEESGAIEMLFVHKGFVYECSRSNIFLVSGETLITPKGSILEGTTRGAVLEDARALSIHIEERAVTTDELFLADEIFITATGKGIVPITTIDSKVISSGLPGNTTQALMKRLNEQKTRHARAS